MPPVHLQSSAHLQRLCQPGTAAPGCRAQHVGCLPCLNIWQQDLQALKCFGEERMHLSMRLLSLLLRESTPCCPPSLGCGSNDGVEVHVIDAGLWLGAQH